MEQEKEIPYKIVATKFIGCGIGGTFKYEITFNQSVVHTGRFTGIEEGLDRYRENENKELEEKILARAEEIKKKNSQIST